MGIEHLILYNEGHRRQNWEQLPQLHVLGKRNLHARASKLLPQVFDRALSLDVSSVKNGDLRTGSFHFV